MFKRSVNIEVIYSELPWTERFAAAKADGFDYIEFWGWEDKNLFEVKKLLNVNNLKISGMSGDGPYSMCDPHTKNDYIAYINKSIEAAKVIDCPILIVHSNALADNPQYAADFYERYSYTVKICAMFDNLKAMVPLAEDEGIIFALEALNVVTDHLGNFLTTTQTSAELVQATGSSQMKILYDAYHMYLNEGKICEMVSKYASSIAYIHIADAPGRHEPGTGVINYHHFLKHLKDIGYSHFVGFELYPMHSTELAVAAIKQACENS